MSLLMKNHNNCEVLVPSAISHLDQTIPNALKDNMPTKLFSSPSPRPAIPGIFERFTYMLRLRARISLF